MKTLRYMLNITVLDDSTITPVDIEMVLEDEISLAIYDISAKDVTPKPKQEPGDQLDWIDMLYGREINE